MEKLIKNKVAIAIAAAVLLFGLIGFALYWTAPVGPTCTNVSNIFVSDAAGHKALLVTGCVLVQDKGSESFLSATQP